MEFANVVLVWWMTYSSNSIIHAPVHGGKILWNSWRVFSVDWKSELVQVVVTDRNRFR